MNNLQVLVRCYDKVATRSVSATCSFGREAPARVTRRAARRYCPGLAGVARKASFPSRGGRPQWPSIPWVVLYWEEIFQLRH